MTEFTPARKPLDPSLRDALKTVSFFHGLDDAALEQICRRVRRRRYEAQEALFHQGDPGLTMYVVLEGRVRIYKTSPSGQSVHIAFREPGEYFGELALIDGAPRMADAATVLPSDLVMLDRDAFLGILEASPKIALSVMSSLAERLRAMGEYVENRQGQDVLARVAGALAERARAHKTTAAGGGIRIAEKVTHQDLADEVGATRESVSRAVSQLREARAIGSEGRTLIILDLKKLRRIQER